MQLEEGKTIFMKPQRAWSLDERKGEHMHEVMEEGKVKNVHCVDERHKLATSFCQINDEKV